MEDQYGMADLRHYISSRPIFPPIPQPPDLLSTHRGLAAAAHPYDMLIFRSDSAAANNTSNNAAAASSSAAAGHCFGGFESGLNVGGGDGGAGRWPRQETLTLLEIRSRLDPKFKEANQKGPLWDEVSRIMSEEHGYQRSGKKCREKFENLYKYYKKTKEGKAGRQDGKHYRFFRQLEALYGEANNSSASMPEDSHLAAGGGSGNGSYHSNYANKSALVARNMHEGRKQVSDTSLSLSNYSDAEETSSSDESDLNDGGGEGKKGGWKAKIKDFIDAQMRKLMEKQEAWMEKMMRAMEEKERERAAREEEWRRHDAARVEREHKFWAGERAWIEARDAALMDALHKLTGKEAAAAAAAVAEMGTLSNDDGSETMTGDIWPEWEINRLMQLRAATEGRGAAEEMVWEEIAAKMSCFGHERSATVCKDKWEAVNNYVLKCGKKRKDNSTSCNYFHGGGGGGGGGVYCDTSEQGNSDHQHQKISLNNHDHGSSSPNPNAETAAISESCFRYFMGEGYERIID